MVYNVSSSILLGICDTDIIKDTKEGIDTGMAISYYSRMRLLSNLLPLLRQSPRPRVELVLGAGTEKAILEHDLGLETNWTSGNMINHTIAMTSLALSYLASKEENKNITFLHTGPGLVKTDILWKLTAPEDSSLGWRITLPLFKGFLGVMWHFMGISAEESGERGAYHLTSDDFGPGASRVTPASEIIPLDSKRVVEKYLESGLDSKVWEHTSGVFDKALTRE